MNKTEQAAKVTFQSAPPWSRPLRVGPYFGGCSQKDFLSNERAVRNRVSLHSPSSRVRNLGVEKGVNYFLLRFAASKCRSRKLVRRGKAVRCSGYDIHPA
jgi:hypothetical protein